MTPKNASVRLRQIDRHNWAECISLRVRDDQVSLVGPNVRTLAECYVRPEAVPYAIYSLDGHMVGFIAYLRDLASGSYYIHRLMVDHRYQRQGFARYALKQTLQEIEKKLDYYPPVKLLFLTYNSHAEAFYRKFGFQDSGEIIDDEKLFTISGTNSSMEG